MQGPKVHVGLLVASCSDRVVDRVDCANEQP